MKPSMPFIGAHLLLLALVLFALYLFPPKFTVQQPRTVTATGIAKTQKTNEVAQFTAGVNAVNDDKQKAVGEVDTKVKELIKAIKAFGIDSKDIKTQNLNIYQNQESYFEGGTQKQRLGQWNVSNNVEMTLRDVARANDLATLLSQSGANNVYGPNFSLDTDMGNDQTLVKQALDDAKAKAQNMAKNAGMSLGKVITVQEGTNAELPILYGNAKGMGGGGGMPTEAGSTTVSKTMTVTYELK